MQAFHLLGNLLAGEEVVGAEVTPPRRSKRAIPKTNTFLPIATFTQAKNKRKPSKELLDMKGYSSFTH